MDEKKREEIKSKAKGILDDFSKALSGVKIKAKGGDESVGGFREEGQGKKADEEFRERMFANAPAKEGDFIIAEKKTW